MTENKNIFFSFRELMCGENWRMDISNKSLLNRDSEIIKIGIYGRPRNRPRFE